MYWSPRSFAPALVALALHLSGCATPLSPDALCFAEATGEYRALWREAQVVRTDLERGFALAEAPVSVVRVDRCQFGATRGICFEPGEETLTRAVEIDRAAHLRRLSELEGDMDRLRPAAMARAAPCGYGDWADPQAPRD